jgi:proteasome beta subunit
MRPEDTGREAVSKLHAEAANPTAARTGDFMRLLQSAGYSFPASPTREPTVCATAGHAQVQEAHGTTVIAVKYKNGVLNVGDRRATAATAIMYDRAEKVLPLDDHTLIAIAGSYARAMEVVRYLRHSFKYYARTQLQEMSLDGKVNELARAISANLTSALQGIGAFLPILSAWDKEANEGRIFFYDAMGARFESAEFAAAGSGAERIRGAFDYIVRTKKPFTSMSLEEALAECLILLDIAADLDAATGGYTKIPPVARAVTANGILDIDEPKLREVVRALVAAPALKAGED